MKPLIFLLMVAVIGSVHEAYAQTVINEPTSVELTDINDTSLDVTAGGTITDATGTNLAIDGAASFNAGLNNITLGDDVSDTTNFGSVGLMGGAVSLQEDSATDLDTTDVTNLNLMSAGSITNAPGATISVSGVADLSATSVILNNAVNDFGILRGTVSDAFIATDVNNLIVGPITSNSGNISLVAGGLLVLDGLTSIPLLDAAGQVSLNGAIDLASDVTITGSQAAFNGILDFDLFGATPNNYEQVFVNGDASVDGTIQVALNAYSPVLGDTFDILAANNLDLLQAGLDLPPLTGGLVFDSSIFDDVSNNQQVLRLTVNQSTTVPIPSTLLIFGLGFAGFVAWRYRAEKIDKN